MGKIFMDCLRRGQLFTGRIFASRCIFKSEIFCRC